MDVKVPSPRDVRIWLAVTVTVILLAVDDINPVKIFCSILGIHTAVAAWLGLLSFCAIFSANASELIFYFVKVFITSIFSIFFSSIEVLGRQNIPAHGPVIFTGNHMNQFVDAGLILITCPYRVGFLIAEKSYNQRVIGDFAKAVGCFPVSRPQDGAKRGPGLVRFEQHRVLGQNTSFTALARGDRLRPGRSAEAYRIKEVLSDTEALLADESSEPSPLSEPCQGSEAWVVYDILAFIDQGKVFEIVEAALAQGNNLAIFPEGGSHDNTDLLPLKAGVSAITFGVLDKFDVSVPIVPVGLNYFRGHRFRGRVVVEYGQPILITKTLHELYKQSKRAAYQTLLTQVEEGMRSVIVTAPSYEELKLIHTARRLYQRPTKTNTGSISMAQRQDLARRFATAYRLLKEKYTDEASVPEDLRQLLVHLEVYQGQLDRWGLKDYQVMSDLDKPLPQLLYIFLHGALVLALASIPSLILNAPVGAAAKYWSFKQAQKDLKASRVKLAARDVLLSKKIVFSLVAVPTLWLTYAALLLLFSPLETRTVVVLFLCCPVFSYIGVMAVEAGMVDVKSLRPSFLRLLPGYQKQVQHLPQMRAELQREVRALVKKYGPEFGPLYFDKSSSWEHSFIKKSSSNPVLSELIASSKKDE